MTKTLVNRATDELDRISDEDLLSRYREKGRTEDFNELVHRYQNELYRYLARYTGDAALAEDVFQNTFLQENGPQNFHRVAFERQPQGLIIRGHMFTQAHCGQGRIFFLGKLTRICRLKQRQWNIIRQPPHCPKRRTPIKPD